MAYLSKSPVTAPAAYFILPLILPSIGDLLLDHIAERSSLSFLGPQQSWAQNVPIEGFEPKPRPLVVGVSEPVGAGLVLNGGQTLFVRRLLFTSQCSLPGSPASQTPIHRIRTTLWRGPQGHVAKGASGSSVGGGRLRTWRAIRRKVCGCIVARRLSLYCVLQLRYHPPVDT